MVFQILQQRVNQRLKPVSLSTLLIGPFVLQIIGTVGLVGYLSFRNGQQAVNNLASDLRDELTARIEQQLQTYVEIPHSINRINANALVQGKIDLAEGGGENQLWQQAKIFPNTNLIYCGSEQDGSFVGVGRDLRDRTMQLVVYNDASGHVANYYSLDALGNRAYLFQRGTKVYDPRVRPWYLAAKASGGPTWSDIYLDFDTQLPTITASVPVYEEAGNGVMGVCATDFILPAEMSNFLKTLEIGKSGETFIMERSGNLVSTSTADPLLVGTGEEARRRLATESDDPLVKGTAEFLNQQFADLNTIQRSQQLDFDLAGQRHFVQVLPFNDGRGLDWLIVLVIPEADFMGQIRANNRTTLVLCLIALAIATGIGILASRWISRPVLELTAASQSIAGGNLDQHVEIRGVNELETLAGSFNSMASQLRQSFAELETRNAELKNREDRFRSLISNIPGAIYRYHWQEDWRLEFISDAIQDICGYSAADLLENHQRTHFNLIYPDDQAMTELAIQQSIAHQIPYILEYRVLHRDGDIRWIAEKGRAVLNKEGHPVYLDGALFDISDRKQAEEARRIAEENYRGIFENALEGIFQSTADGQFLNVNPAMARIHGYDSPEDMVAAVTQIDRQIYVDPDQRNEFKQLMDRQGKVNAFEYQAYRKDGSIIWVEENTRIVRDGNGRLLYYEGIIQDITQRKEREDALQRQVQELRIEIDQQKLKQEVSAIIQTDYFRELQAEAENLRRNSDGT